MRNIKPISVLLVGIVSAAIYGGVTVLCAPPVLLFLTAGSAPALDADPIGGWATVAVFAPLVSSAIGFCLGVFMASMFNFFVRQAFGATPAVVTVRPARPQLYIGQSDVSDSSSPSSIRLVARRTL